jgi:hypothetical protein
MSWSLALDFGTSNTAAAYRFGTEVPKPVQLSDQGHQVPSAVLALDGDLRVGTEAVRAQRVAPERFLESPKLLVGQDSVLLGDDEMGVPDLVAAVLGNAARRAARAAGGGTLDRVVLTHPYEWAEPRKNALREAWRRTGVEAEALELVSEPVAAASWFAASAPPPVGSYVGVFDFGGGTCDVAVLRHTGAAGRPFDVVGHDGRGDLGGRVIDQLLLGHVRRALVRTGRPDLNRALDTPQHLGALRTLQEHVRQAKHALSEWEDAAVPVAVAGSEHIVVVTATELEHLVADVVAQARALTVRTIQHAGIAPKDLHALYLTGGSSRLRPVAATLEDVLGGRPATLDDPKLVVALGAHHATTPDRQSAVHVGFAHGGRTASEADQPTVGRREKSQDSDAPESVRRVAPSDVPSPARPAVRQRETSAVRRAVLMCSVALLPANLTLMGIMIRDASGGDVPDAFVIIWLLLLSLGVIGSGVWAARTRRVAGASSARDVVLLSLIGCAAVILTVVGAAYLEDTGVDLQLPLALLSPAIVAGVTALAAVAFRALVRRRSTE